MARPATPPAPRLAPDFPATSLARVWLSELHAENRWRRMVDRLGLGLIAAAGAGGVLYLALSTLDFTAHWTDFARLIASVFS